MAAASGVSRGTVSRYINGGHWVSAESRTAIEAAIRATGFQANPHARALATGRSGAVGFLITEPQHLLFDDPVFALMLRGATAATAARDLQLVLLMASDEADRRRVVDYVTARHIDGVMLASTHRSDPMLGTLLRHEVPTVTLGVALGHEGRVSSVTADDRLGGREATRYLLSRGRRRVATITGPEGTPGGVLRHEGYHEALGESYDERLVVHGDYARASGRAGMAELLDRDPGVDAVFAHNDIMALGAIEELHDRGLTVPGDVAVVGFDDSGPGERSRPALTTMRQPYERLAFEMVRLLVAAIEGEPPSGVVMPATLVARESA
ncbi:LacI family DNA-binding transcriptional regulator [Xylanimonas protaetiae]|uniref:LacI family DNA-binding transcriptional regulator n=1 Tax=Xylanimonas protaetiae TaxID=2509457 RepID=UPI003159A304